MVEFTKKKLAEPVLEALRTIEYRENDLLLHGHLEREDYDVVAKVFKTLDVKWQKGKETFAFKKNPKADIERIIKEGREPKKNPLAFFPTPKVIADQVAEQAICHFGRYDDRQTTFRVLEPSIGEGSLIEAIQGALEPGHSLDVVSYELDPERAEKCFVKGFNTVCGDFMSETVTGEFDLIVMNPPFSTTTDRVAWINHTKKAWGLVKERGLLIAILPRTFEQFRKKDSKCGLQILGELDVLWLRYSD